MNICLYGASSNQLDATYITLTEQLGRCIGERGHHLIYGGGAEGLMGAAARGVTRSGGQVIGIAPSFFKVDGVLYQECTEFIYTETMRERKQTMETKADAFIMVPGGTGTFDEFFEILTLKQLGRHNKPIAIFNENGYFNALIALLDKAIEENFMTDHCRTLWGFFDDPDALIDYLEGYSSEKVNIKDFKNI